MNRQEIEARFEGDRSNPKDVVDFAEELGVIEEFNEMHGVNKSLYNGDTPKERFLDYLAMYPDNVEGAWGDVVTTKEMVG